MELVLKVIMTDNQMINALEKELNEKVSNTYILTREQMLAILNVMKALDDIVDELTGENKNGLHQRGNERSQV